MRLKFLNRIALSALIVTGITLACDQPTTHNPTTPVIPSLNTLDIVGPASIAPGQPAQLSVTAHLGDGTVKTGLELTTVAWHSSNPAVLSVNPTGMLSPTASQGEATITAQLRLGSGPLRQGSRDFVVLPAGTFRLVGRITEDQAAPVIPIAGARVEVASGAPFAITDASGNFRLYGVPPTADIRVSAPGYATQTYPVQLSANSTQNFTIALSGPRPSIAGDYTLFIDATGACSSGLTSTFQHRSYLATIDQSDINLEVRLTEPRFNVDSSGRGNHFSGTDRRRCFDVQARLLRARRLLLLLLLSAGVVPVDRRTIAGRPESHHIRRGGDDRVIRLLERDDERHHGALRFPFSERLVHRIVLRDAAVQNGSPVSASAFGRFVVIFVSVVATAAAWGMSRPVTPPIGLVIITLDTTRADRLSPYGFMDISLPAIERLAREGVVFDDATTAVPLTLPSHTSLFTGLLPPDHGVRDNADPPLADSKATLAQTLLSRGFRTGAFVGSIVLNPDRGLQRGFEVYHGVTGGPPDTPQGRQRRADAVADDALQWLDTIGDAPFFLWAHFYDAHRPYDPPEPFASTYAHDPYLGEIAFADAQVGRLIGALESRHLLDRTVVVVAGDHGESLGEHGERDHGVFVYESVLRVPLIIRAPSIRTARVGSAVRLIDVMPTVLDLLHVPAPAVDGVSTVDLMTGRQSDLKLPIYAESLYPERLGWSGLRALREGQFKFIDAPRPELYDLADDPFEEVNLYANRRALAETLRIAAAGMAKGANGSDASAERSRVSPQLQARLEALGYVAGAVSNEAAAGRAKPDPKDCVQHVRPLACGWWAMPEGR